MASSKLRISQAGMKRFLAAAFAVLFINTQQAGADNVSTPIEIMISEQARIDRYVELDFARQDLMFHQTSTILALYGGYNSYTKSDDSQSNGSDMTRFKNRAFEYVPSALVDFRRKTARDASLTSEEASMSSSAEALMEEMLDAAREIIELCDADKPLEASHVYRDKSMPLNAKLLGTLYTLRSEAAGRFKKSALKAKYQ